MNLELVIGQEVYSVIKIVETPYSSASSEKSENGITRTIFSRSDNRFFLKIDGVISECLLNRYDDVNNIIINQFKNSGEIVRKITIDSHILSNYNDLLEIDCKKWIDEYID